MKIKTQLTLATVIAAGLLASGCSSQQMVAQQAAPAVAAAPVVEAIPQPTTVKTVIDCSDCRQPAVQAPRPRPQPNPRPRGNMHSHPAVAGCTNAVRHNHPHPQGGRHSHKYSCKKPVVKQAPQRPAPKANPNAHSHPAVPNCTRAVNHVHANGNRAHQHRHACQQPVVRPAPRPIYRPAPQPAFQQPVMPKVKAKGTYKGPIKIDGMMQQYQQ